MHTYPNAESMNRRKKYGAIDPPCWEKYMIEKGTPRRSTWLTTMKICANKQLKSQIHHYLELTSCVCKETVLTLRP